MSFIVSQSVRWWDKALPDCLMTYRNSEHKSTAQSQPVLTCGRELRLPTNLHLAELGSVTILTHNFAVIILKTIREA